MIQPTDPSPIDTADLALLADEAIARCLVLARETEEPGRLTRTFLSPPMRPVHDLVAGWMRDAGMMSWVDAAGNLTGHYPAEGHRPDARAVVIGSHLDTVPDAGMFDGMLGVLLGVAAVAALHRAGRRLPFAVDVLGFSEEEGVRYRTPYLGSLAYAGRFDPALLDLVDAGGVTMADAFRRFGLDPARVHEAASPPGRLLAYLEAHIEQGPVLEAAGLPVGVVTAIAGQSRLLVTFEGQAGHAGTAPMDLRRDALAGAAELIVAVERTARAFDGLRGTVGWVEVRPGGTNVVPGLASLSLDLRHQLDWVREHAVAHLLTVADRAAADRKLTFRVDRRQDHPAVPTDPELTHLLADAVRTSGIETKRLVSGAGHDAAVIAGIAPTTMLFLRSPGGISHHPDERVEPADVRAALAVMVRWLLTLAESEPPIPPGDPG